MDSITTKQIRMIFGLARKSGFDNETVHLKAHALTGKDSLKELTKYEANCLIGVLQHESYPKEQTVYGRATAAQKRMILGIARSMGWMDNPKRLRGFLEAKHHVSDINFLPAEQVSSVIEALKAMQARGYGERIQKHQGAGQ